MKLRFATLLVMAISAGIASSAAQAQTFQYDTRWYAGVRDNVIELQDRHRARIEALDARRKQKAEAADRASVNPPKANATPAVTLDR